jgi:hypothetical protein
LSDNQFYADRWLPSICVKWEKQDNAKDQWHWGHDFGDDKREIIDQYEPLYEKNENIKRESQCCW